MLPPIPQEPGASCSLLLVLCDHFFLLLLSVLYLLNYVCQQPTHCDRNYSISHRYVSRLTTWIHGTSKGLRQKNRCQIRPSLLWAHSALSQCALVLFSSPCACSVPLFWSIDLENPGTKRHSEVSQDPHVDKVAQKAATECDICRFSFQEFPDPNGHSAEKRWNLVASFRKRNYLKFVECAPKLCVITVLFCSHSIKVTLLSCLP